MFELKVLSKASIPLAIQKATRYRLLNEPYEAVSICMDILEVDPDHQEALVTLLLAQTDQFKEALFPAFDRAIEVLNRLSNTYCKTYYRGIINERRAKAHLATGGPEAGLIAYDWYVKAMTAYEEALQGCAPDKEDAILRYNTCVRMLNETPELKPAESDRRDAQVMDGYE